LWCGITVVMVVVGGGRLIKCQGGVGWRVGVIVAVDELDIYSHIHSHISLPRRAPPQTLPLSLKSTRPGRS
jgi:hypothetical protein